MNNYVKRKNCLEDRRIQKRRQVNSKLFILKMNCPKKDESFKKK